MVDGISQRLIMFIVFLPLYLIATSFHEFGHAYAAYKCGDDTATRLGRLTLNPMAHIDPAGLLMFAVTVIFSAVGFGWAKPVPINPLRFRKIRRDTIIVSIAGVAGNFFLLILGIILLKGMMMAGFLSQETPLARMIWQIMMQFIFFNGVLIAFNLIPVPPLDGSKILMMLLPLKSAIKLEKIEPYGMLVILLLMYLHVIDFIVGIMSVVLGRVLNFVL